MINAEERKAVRLRVPQAVGQLGRVLAPIAEARINVLSLNTVTVNDEAYLTVVTDNNRQAIELWERAGFLCEEVGLIGLELPNKPGELATVANRLGQAGVDIRYAYASSHGSENNWVFLATSNDQEALRRIRS